MSSLVNEGSKGLIASLENQNKVLEEDIVPKNELQAPQIAAQKIHEINRAINRLIKLK